MNYEFRYMPFAKYSKFFSLAAKIALMFLAFWLVARGVDRQELKEMLVSQNRTAFIGASFFFFTQVFFGSVRWRVVIAALAGAGTKIISRLGALTFFYISVFFNCCLPGTVGGDVVRVWLIKSDHTPLPLAISSVVIDRVIALLALGVMGAITSPLLAGYMEVNAWLMVSGFSLLFAFAIWILFNLEKLLGRSEFVKKLNWLEYLLQNVSLMLARPSASLSTLFYAVLAHGSFCVAAYILADSLGSPISLIDSFTLIPWVLLISIIPISIGGWGLREAAMVFFLGLVGVPQAVALTLSVQLGLLSVLLSLPAGVLWLVNRAK